MIREHSARLLRRMWRATMRLALVLGILVATLAVFFGTIGAVWFFLMAVLGLDAQSVAPVAVPVAMILLGWIFLVLIQED